MYTQEISRRSAVKVFEWCKKTLGPSSVNGPYPKLIFHRTKKPYAGLYDPWKNEIHVAGPSHRSFTSFIGTVIHEFAHYHQSIKREYQRHSHLSYKSNPLEREAIRMERKYKWQCYYEVFSPDELFTEVRKD